MPHVKCISGGYAGIHDGKLFSVREGDVIEVSAESAKYLVSGETPGVFEMFDAKAEAKEKAEPEAKSKQGKP